MSLLTVVKNGLDKAWTALGDLIRPVTYRRMERAAYSPDAPQNVTVTETTLRAALVEYAVNLINGTDIRAGDQMCILRARDLAFEPRQGDTIIDGSDTWTVMRVGGDRRIYWHLTLRK
jgi:hypothetical protein